MDTLATPSAGRTFPVTKVTPPVRVLDTAEYATAVRTLSGNHPLEAWAHTREKLVAHIQGNALLGALHNAYSSHFPLVLSPDMIWITLCQGVAKHITTNSEALRDLFVDFEGKKELLVACDDFSKGSPDNDWARVFPDFSRQIGEHIGLVNQSKFLPGFSTTGPTEQVVSEIVLMDAMQNYFSYGCDTSCGIPEITLEGTVQDWQQIASRVEGFSLYGLAWWVDQVQPVLEEFAWAAAGQINWKFWQSLYHWVPVGSGNPYITGHILRLFPYLLGYKDKLERNRYLPADPVAGNTPQRGFSRGPILGDIPSSLSTVPFTWYYHSQEIPMQFLGGLVGIYQDPMTLAVRPEVGWAVRELPAEAGKASKARRVREPVGI